MDAAGLTGAAPSGIVRPTRAGKGSATSSLRSTCTLTICASGPGRGRNGNSTLTFMRQIRLAYPRRLRIYWIQDGLSSPWTPDIRAYAEANNIELVPTPTYASYLNRIESTFGSLNEFVCKNADHLDWDAFGYALADHVRHRNSPADS